MIDDHGRRGFTLWLTGLSGSGKSTLGRSIQAKLTERGRRVEILDGDDIRSSISADLGFSKKDRDANIRRIGFIARLLSRNGVAVIVAAISPYRDVRQEVRDAQEAPFIEVFVDCSLTELQRRDTKGLYKRAMAGDVGDLTGVSAPYEPPRLPDIHVRTDDSRVGDCTDVIVADLERRGLF